MTVRFARSENAPRRPTVKTLSELTGYSISTVSKALRDSPAVTHDTKARIRSVAKQVAYAANPRAASLRTGKTMQAAVLMPVSVAAGNEWNGVEFTEILSGIARALEGSPYQLSVHIVRDAEDGHATANRIVTQGLADGMIFSGILERDPRIAFLLAQDFPFVTLGRTADPKGYAHVDIDSGWVAAEATRRLIDGGHRRIALINPDRRYAYAQERIGGFRGAFAAAGLPACDDLIAEGDLTARFGRESAMALCSRGAPPTGFVCVNEPTTLGVLAGLRDCGLSAETDVSVIGYDDLNVSGYFSPPLTTHFQPVEEMGHALGAFLIRRMAGEPPETLVRVFRPKLIARRPDRLAAA